VEFLLGFFSNNAADFAPRYIKALEKELETAEKRSLARALAGAGFYAESMRLLSSGLNNDGIEPDREDLELLYPRPFKELVEKYAQEYDLAPELLFGLIRTESAFQSGIVSRAGAVGLTQLMPATAQEMADRIRRRGGPDYTPLDAALRDSETNIHIGAVYLRYLMDRMESPLLALLAYNGGMNRVRRWRGAARNLSEDLFLETIAYPETREYGRKVIAAEAVYRALYY
jgi:soluble lytic murein transglycosylase